MKRYDIDGFGDAHEDPNGKWVELADHVRELAALREGTMPLWGQLVAAGYVEQRERSILGHDFSYGLTRAGMDILESANPHETK